MDPGTSAPLGELGEDLVLLSLLPHDGRVASPQQLAFALMGSELVRLAAADRIAVQRGRVVVTDPAQTGDAELDAALRSLARARQPPRAKDWVRHPRKGLCDTYLVRLAVAGAVRRERRPLRGLNRTGRWRVADEGRLAGARARLDAIVRSDGPVDATQAAFAGLAHAAGLGMRFYPGWENRQPRHRLEQIARHEVPATGPDTGAGAVAATATAGASAAVRQAAWAAQQTAVQAANQAVQWWLTCDPASAAAHHAAAYGGGGHTGGSHTGGGHMGGGHTGGGHGM